MFPLRICALFGLAALAATSALAVSPLERSKKLQAEAVNVAKTDHVGSGWCGRGVRHVLTEIGLGEGLKGANGHDWEANLRAAGWKAVSCANPRLAPEGSVLVYNSDLRIHGANLRGTPGGRYGHVEFVARDSEGKRFYVADHARLRPGGTVPDNFTRRAWLPPTAPTREMLLLAIRATIDQDVAELRQQRIEQALEFFERQELPQVGMSLLEVADEG